jgi:hypothetical protein
MMGDELISFTECFHTLMRRLNNIAITMPRKESEKVLYIISQLENLITFPADIRLKKDYEEESC